jgi:hypothetical protein
MTIRLIVAVEKEIMTVFLAFLSSLYNHLMRSSSYEMQDNGLEVARHFGSKRILNNLPRHM